jgi:peptidoglycan hydrolase-like protein with peptidoglycan-binding domain
MQPAPERYKEIQQALFDRGYFMGQVDGSWGPDSTDALKRFQTDQSLDADGKIGALSLIALGLGPRRSAAAKPGAESAPAQESAESPEPVAFPLPPQDAN